MYRMKRFSWAASLLTLLLFSPAHAQDEPVTSSDSATNMREMLEQ